MYNILKLMLVSVTEIIFIHIWGHRRVARRTFDVSILEAMLRYPQVGVLKLCEYPNIIIYGHLSMNL